MSKRVSIVIPCYNAENTIDRAIESVYLQDYPNIELIIVDDGSTDSSKEKILAWQPQLLQKGIDLQYVYQENKGSGGAINTGLKYVTGDYLTLLDADDRFLPGCIEKRVNFLANNPDCFVVRSNGWTVNKESRWLFVSSDAEKNTTDVFRALLLGETNNWAGSYTVLTKPLFAFYPERNIYTSRFGQNLQILLPLLYKRKCGFLDEPMMEYIRQENSLSSSGSKENAFQKACKNAEGYRDIREYMVNRIITCDDERTEMLRYVHSGHCRRMMAIALEFNDIRLLEQYFRELKALGSVTRNDRITYYQSKCKPIALWLRILRKTERLLTGEH